MKILYLNTTDTGGGAAVAAMRLLRGVRAIGADASLAVQYRRMWGPPEVYGPRSFVENHLRYYLESLPVKRYSNRTTTVFSPAFLPDRVMGLVREFDPDVVHLHWIGFGFCRIETLRRLRRPIVWTLHDMWPFTGGCYYVEECTRYQQSCGACPVLGSMREKDLSRWVWERKNKAWKGLDLTVVSPSRWLAECARSSSLFADARIEVIPNGLDTFLFRPMERREARRLLGLPDDRKLVLFGAMDATSDKRKGFHLLLPSLQRLAAEGWRDRLELAVFGSDEPQPPPDFGLPAHYLGRFDDEARIALLYAAADLFVAPSLQENLSNTVMEALACGTPTVAFDIGGMPDMIEHGRNGYLARPYEPEDLARGMAWVLEDEGRHAELCRNARSKVEQEFAVGKVAGRYLELYGAVKDEGPYNHGPKDEG